MGLFNMNTKGGWMDVIRCDESDYLLWKWHPKGSRIGQGKRENTIRWGSSLRVKEGEVAIFLYEQNQGSVPDYFQGPCDITLETNNLPILSSLLGIFYNGNTPFQAEVYFINTAETIQIKFGIPFFDVFDPKYPEFSVPIAVRGSIMFRIVDYKRFVKIHKLENLSIRDFQLQVRDMACKYIKTVVSNAPEDYQIPVVQLERKVLEISALIEEGLIIRMQEDLGVQLTAIDITDIEIDKSSRDYRQLMSISRDATASLMREKNLAEVQNIKDLQRISVHDHDETMRIKREETQYAQRLQTQSAYSEIHELNQKTDVGKIAAEALGKMEISVGGGGINPAGIMTSLMMGDVIGHNMAMMVDDSMKERSRKAEMAPPPISQINYFVAINGKPEGPFNEDKLIEMASLKKLTHNSKVWAKGMADWKFAGEITELQMILENVPPELH